MRVETEDGWKLRRFSVGLPDSARSREKVEDLTTRIAELFFRQAAKRLER
jgi:hypothetical protein